MEDGPEILVQAKRTMQTAHRFGSAVVVLLLAIGICQLACENGRRESPSGKPANSPQSLYPAAPPGRPANTRTPAAPALEAYALAQPDRVLELPRQLKEVSGLTDISDHELGCVQDEEGVVFVFDLLLRKITRRLRFGPPGDYEGLSRVGDRFFVLRSDGLLYEVLPTAGEAETLTHALSLPTKDNEGLGLDAGRGRLLIAPKSRLKGRDYKQIRAIFAYDLRRRALLPDPILELSVDAIQDYAESRQLPLPQKRKKNGRTRVALRFMPASIAVHPVTEEVFVLSAVDNVLAAFDLRANVTGCVRLSSDLFRQPEGITFLSNADMVISNEGAGKKATLLLFKWKRRQG